MSRKKFDKVENCEKETIEQTSSTETIEPTEQGAKDGGKVAELAADSQEKDCGCQSTELGADASVQQQVESDFVTSAPTQLLDDNGAKSEIIPQPKKRKRYFNTTRTFFERISNYFASLKPMDGKMRAATLGKSTWSGTKKLSKRWFIEAFTGMAQGLFVTLIAGTIVKQIGKWIGETTKFGAFLVAVGTIASFLMGAGIGAGIASHLKAPKLVIFSCMVAGMLGAFSNQFLQGNWIIANSVSVLSPGNPISAYICALIACEIGKFISGKTKIDILLVPLTVVLVAIGSTYICIPFVKLIDLISKGIGVATGAQPVLMGIVIAVVVGVLLTMPTSSAAICIALQLGGIAGGAAVVGCACQMVGFAVQSFRENKFSGLISQGVGTSMLQIPNIFRKPIIMLPPIIASAIAGPLATSVFMLQCSPAGSGMGTCGFVGIFTTVEASMAGGVPGWKIGLGIALLFFVVPIVVCLVASELMRKFKLIHFGDMMLNYDN